MIGEALLARRGFLAGHPQARMGGESTRDGSSGKILLSGPFRKYSDVRGGCWERDRHGRIGT